MNKSLRITFTDQIYSSLDISYCLNDQDISFVRHQCVGGIDDN